jgi:hypothetical protein
MGQKTNYQATSFQLMRELVILSINLSYVKNAIQHNERFKGELMYLNITQGPQSITELDLIRRKVSLQNRFTSLVEFQLVEKLNRIENLLIVVPLEQAGYRKKEMEQGWAIIPDIYDLTWLLNIRTGQLYENNYTNAKFFMSNILPLGEVYKYFQIDFNNPLPQKDIRY